MNPKQIIPVAASAASAAGPAAPVVVAVIVGVGFLVWLLSDDDKPEAETAESSIFDDSFFAPVLGSKAEERKIPPASAGNTAGNRHIPPVSGGNPPPKPIIPAVSAGQSAVAPAVTRPVPVTPSAPVSAPVTARPVPVAPPVQVVSPVPAPVTVVAKTPIPVPPAPAPVKIPAEIPLPAPRKLITRQDMEKIFAGKANLTRTAAVAALKKLGFGKSAAYDALLPDGRFATWLRSAPDGTISWKN